MQLTHLVSDQPHHLLVLALLLAVLGAYVGIDHAQRSRTAPRAEALRWLTSAGIGLGTGGWSSVVLLIGAQPLGFAIGYDAATVAGAWIIAVGGAAAALRRPADDAAPGWGRAGAVVLLGLALVVAGVAVVAAAGLRPGVHWHIPTLLAAIVVAAAGGAVALAWLPQRAAQGRWLVAWRAGTALMLGVSVTTAQWLVVQAARLQEQAVSAFDGQLPSLAVVLLAGVGSAALLLVLTVASFFEARVRASLSQAQGELQRQAGSDPLTGLPNRGVFEQALVRAAATADGTRTRLAVLFIDVDGFGVTNGAYGHQTGDDVLRHVGAQLRQAAPVEQGDVGTGSEVV